MMLVERDRPPVSGPLARVAEHAYRLEIARRNRRYDAGRGVTRLDLPVISIGNLSVGGTGKTPMVSWTVRELLELGRRPCIAMRGYRKQAGGESDEEAAYRRQMPDCPVVAQPNRLEGIHALRARAGTPPFDVVVLDDGFQHRRLSRDLDVVLIDASRDPFADRLLPAGWLREPIASLERADALVLTHTELVSPEAVDAMEDRLRDRLPDPPIARARHVWRDLLVIDDGVDRREPVSWLSGLRAVAACGVGNPRSFLAALNEATGRNPVGSLVLPDHAAYTEGRIARLVELASAGADAIVTTEKDWSKLAELPTATWPCPIVRPQLETRLDAGAEPIRALLRRCVEPEESDHRATARLR